jgi:hypothetical protein
VKNAGKIADPQKETACWQMRGKQIVKLVGSGKTGMVQVVNM